MNNQDFERWMTCCNDVMPYRFKYPELDLSLRCYDSAYEKALSSCTEAFCEYAQDTATWD